MSGVFGILPLPSFQLIGHILKKTGQLNRILPENSSTQARQALIDKWEKVLFFTKPVSPLAYIR